RARCRDGQGGPRAVRLDTRGLRGGEGGEEHLGEPGQTEVSRRTQGAAGQLRALLPSAHARRLASMADAEAATALALADGRALLTIENRDLGAAGVANVPVGGPGLSPLPEPGPPNGLRRRRGRLLAANLLVDGARLAKLSA